MTFDIAQPLRHRSSLRDTPGVNQGPVMNAVPVIHATLSAAVVVHPLDPGLTVEELESAVLAQGVGPGSFTAALDLIRGALDRDSHTRLLASLASWGEVFVDASIVPDEIRPSAALDALTAAFDRLEDHAGPNVSFDLATLRAECSVADVERALGILVSWDFIARGPEGFTRKRRWAEYDTGKATHPTGPTTKAIARALPHVRHVFATRPAEADVVASAGGRVVPRGAGEHRPVQRASLLAQTKGEDMTMPATPDPTKVFVIHGRNDTARNEVGIFLRSMGLAPLWFRDVRKDMGGTVQIIRVVERGMDLAQGVLALFTPDEFASLHPLLRKTREEGEKVERWQARPNVLFEAGLAYGRDPDRVAFVLFGDVKLFTDASGMHVFWPANDHGPDSYRAQLRGLLAGGMRCAVDMHSNDWMTAGNFDAVTKGLSGVSPRDPFRSAP